MYIDLATTKFFEYLPKVIFPATMATTRMLFFSLVLGFLIGVAVAIALVWTAPSGLKPNKAIYGTMDFVVNAIRSFPVIILIVAITPLTREIVGTSIGEKAAIVPLTIAAFPVIARYIEGSLLEVDRNVILAAKSFGASNIQIIFKVLFTEALPSIITGMTTTAILFLASTTLAGAVGAGGLGAVALTYGYQRFDDIMMYSIVLILFVMVLCIQGLGQLLYKKAKNNKRRT